MLLDDACIGPYRVVRRLGYGRSSEVLLATRSFPGNFDRRVVIKRRLLARTDAEGDRQAFLANEALAYARVAHPAIVQLFDFFEHDGHLVLVLEYVDGLSLTRFLALLRANGGALGDRIAYFIAVRLFAALAAAHVARDPRTGLVTPVIHRDVNPDNVLVPWDGFVKLGDFDLAKVVGVSGDTRAGLMKGTYGYMAPEQVLGDPVTPRTDVYAACLVLRELLLGKRAFDEELPELELLRAMEQSRLAPIESLRGGVSRRLAEAMGRGLARDPAERTTTPAEMVDVLRAQTDMEAAHAELTALLARHRPAEPRGTMSQLARTPPAGLPSAASQISYETPRAMTLSQGESVPPIEPGPASVAPSWRSASTVRVLSLAAVGGGLLAFVALGLGLFAPPRQADALATAAAPVSEGVVVRPVASSTASGTAPPPPAPASPTGDLVISATERSHRVWVDGRIAAWAAGITLRVPCGTHVVRIGSAGESRTVVVPCGGQAIVQAR